MSTINSQIYRLNQKAELKVDSSLTHNEQMRILVLTPLFSKHCDLHIHTWCSQSDVCLCSVQLSQQEPDPAILQCRGNTLHPFKQHTLFKHPCCSV